MGDRHAPCGRLIVLGAKPRVVVEVVEESEKAPDLPRQILSPKNSCAEEATRSRVLARHLIDRLFYLRSAFSFS